MATVYIETTIPSYLTAPRSRDLVVAANQQVTHEWWANYRPAYEQFVSDAVIDEIEDGDPEMAAMRVEAISDMEILKPSPEVVDLLGEFGDLLGLTGVARADVPHFAYAVAYNVDYLLTWNASISQVAR